MPFNLKCLRRTADRELGTEVPGIAKQDDLVIVAVDDPGDFDFDPAEEDIELVLEDYRRSQAALAEHDQPNLVRDVNGVVARVPGDVVRLPDEPNSPGVGVEHGRDEDVALLMEREGRGGSEGRSGHEG